MLLILTDGINKIELTPEKALQLELKLNLTPFGKQWVEIGDHLYYYFHPKPDTHLSDTLYVSCEKFKYLHDLLKKKE